MTRIKISKLFPVFQNFRCYWILWTHSDDCFDRWAFKINLALTGAQVRAGGRHNLALIQYLKEHHQTVSALSALPFLHHFFAEEDSQNITDQYVVDLLNYPLDQDSITTIITNLIISGIRIHPNSFIAKFINDPHLMTLLQVMQGIGVEPEL